MLTIFSVLLATASAHSWVHCTDYRGSKDYYDSNECYGNVRPIARSQSDVIVPAQVAFGVDQGFNRNNADGNPDFRPVDGKCQSTVTDQMAGGDFPMATYQRGQSVTLAWPAKNHAAASCTNRFIPDGFVKLFVEPYKNAQGNRFNQEIDGTWRQFPHQNGVIDFRGFHNCPKFCENPDKALCTGDFVVPDLPDGKYSFQWLWEFNPGDEYVTCFEAEVKGAVGNNPAANVISTDGCNNNVDEATCIAATDGRQGPYQGQKCAWCCGEFCNKGATGGDGGDNRCEPVGFLQNEAGITAFRNNEVDQCPKPTSSPTAEPSPPPTTEPTAKPTAAPTEMPTEVPTMSPTAQMIAPNPSTSGSSGAQECAAEMEMCGGPGAMFNCCQSGLVCASLNNMFSQCQRASGGVPGAGIVQTSGNAVVTTGSPHMEASFDMMHLAAAVLVIAACLCCCVWLIAYKTYAPKRSGDEYQKHNSWSEGHRYSDEHERRDRPKRKRKKSDKDRRSRGKQTPGSPNAPPAPTPGGDDWSMDEATPPGLPRRETPL